MNVNKAKSSSLAAASLLLLLFAYGCDQQGQDTAAPAPVPEATAQGAQPSAASPQEGASSSTSSADDERYNVRSVERPVPVGQKQKVELGITPGDGLKINKEFPWKFEFSPPEGVELAQTTVGGAQIDLAESKATIPVYLEAGSAGKHSLEATGDFSVCNDTKCYVIRDQKVSFALEAHEEQGGQDAPAPVEPDQVEPDQVEPGQAEQDQQQ